MRNLKHEKKELFLLQFIAEYVKQTLTSGI